MKSAQLFFQDNSEIAEDMSKSKGYRNDIFVKYQSQFYKLSVYDTVRLIQDFDSEYNEAGYYSIDPNIVIVKNVTTHDIVFTIKKLIEQFYFEQLLPVKEGELPALVLIAEIENAE